MTRLNISSLSKLSGHDADRVLDAAQHEAEMVGGSYATRRIKRIDQLRDELNGPEEDAKQEQVSSGRVVLPPGDRD